MYVEPETREAAGGPPGSFAFFASDRAYFGARTLLPERRASRTLETLLVVPNRSRPPVRGPTSNQDPAAVVRVPRAAPVLVAALGRPGGGRGAALLPQEAPGQSAVGVLVLLVLLQPLRLLLVPHLHAQCASGGRSSAPFLSLCETKGEMAEKLQLLPGGVWTSQTAALCRAPSARRCWLRPSPAARLHGPDRGRVRRSLRRLGPGHADLGLIDAVDVLQLLHLLILLPPHERERVSPPGCSAT